MRYLIFAFALFLMSCGGEQQSSNSSSPAVSTPKTESGSDAKTVITPAPTSKGHSDVNAKYKKTAKNSEFAVFKTTSATDTDMEFYFKTLDGISIKTTYKHEGGRKVVGFDQLLEFAKYMEGHPGANGEMAGKIFELIYDENNEVGEVRLAELDE